MNSRTIWWNPGAEFRCSHWRIDTEGAGAALPLAGDTRRTGAVNVKLVPGCAKTPGQFWLALCNASFEVIQFAACVALEVMMMLFAGHFEVRRVAKHLDRLQPSFLDQRLDTSVDRGNPNARVVLLCRSENFFRGQRPKACRRTTIRLPEE